MLAKSCAFTGTLLLSLMLPFEFDAPQELRVYRHSPSRFDAPFMLPKSCAFTGTLLLGLMLPSEFMLPKSGTSTGTLLLSLMLPSEFDAHLEYARPPALYF